MGRLIVFPFHFSERIFFRNGMLITGFSTALGSMRDVAGLALLCLSLSAAVKASVGSQDRPGKHAPHVNKKLVYYIS